MKWHPVALLVLASFVQAGDFPRVTRLCVEADGMLFVESDCGCNDALLCSTELIDKTVKVTVSTDPNRARMCRDCFAMVPGRCEIPPAANGRVEIMAGPLRLPVDLTTGKPLERACTSK